MIRLMKCVPLSEYQRLMVQTAELKRHLELRDDVIYHLTNELSSCKK